MSRTLAVLAISQGDPAGVGPEVALRAVATWRAQLLEQVGWLPLLFVQRQAIAALAEALGPAAAGLLPDERHLAWIEPGEGLRLRATQAAASGRVPLVEVVVGGTDPADLDLELGVAGPAAAQGALAALHAAEAAVRSGEADALVTAPLNKATIAEAIDPDFRGHTDHLAVRAGASAYGRDYLMTFLCDEFRVALLSTHVPLRAALDHVSGNSVLDALRCLQRAGARRIALAGLNPHAGEGGLLGSEDDEVLVPAVAEARAAGIDVSGPWSPDTVFHRARQGDFDWVLALYHDQGLIAVKTLGFGSTVNWTLGLPYLRTSPDHGTAYDIAGRGTADPSAMGYVLEKTARLVRERRLEIPRSDDRGGWPRGS